MRKIGVFVIILAVLIGLAVWLVKEGLVLGKAEEAHIETHTGYADEARKSMEQMNKSVEQTNKAAQELLRK